MDRASASREAQMSIAASAMFPGFRFSPTDEELISYYLKNKITGSEKTVELIPEIEIWKHEPWELPVVAVSFESAKSVIPSDGEWFFFSPRGRKYPNGSQSRRATELGYWKATGKERNVKSGSGSGSIGTKRTLVFHLGRAPRGERTEWIMHEYCLIDKSQDFMVVCRLRRNIEFRLNGCTNRASTSQRPSSTIRNSNASEVNSDRFQSDRVNADGFHADGVNGDEFHADGVNADGFLADRDNKVDGFYLKKCSISHGSYSFEQNDSTSESYQKPASEVTQPECSHKVNDDGDDFFAEILKDDIIKLDKTSLTTGPDPRPWVDHGASMSTSFDRFPFAAEDEHEPPAAESAMSHVAPFQGTANRRIRLSKESHSSRPVNDAKSKPSPKITATCHVLVVLLLLLTLVALFLYLLGGPFMAHCVKAS